MLYEMRIYTCGSHQIPEYIEKFSEVFERRQKISRVIGFFRIEIGELNRVMHIWEYEDVAHRERVRKEAMEQPWWPPDIEGIVRRQENKLMTTPPFRPEPLLGNLGDVYEVRTYTIQVRKMGEVVSRYIQHVPPREELSPISACFITDSGPLNEFIHIYPYKDLNHRAQIRQKASKLPNWPPGGHPFYEHQKTEIWIPTSFSLMH